MADARTTTMAKVEEGIRKDLILAEGEDEIMINPQASVTTARLLDTSEKHAFNYMNTLNGTSR